MSLPLYYIDEPMLAELGACSESIDFLNREFAGKVILDKSTVASLVKHDEGRSYLRWLAKRTYVYSPAGSESEAVGWTLFDAYRRGSYARDVDMDALYVALVNCLSSLQALVISGRAHRRNPINYPKVKA